MTKLKLGIIGCGYLSNIIVDAYNNGLLKEYELVGVLGRNSKSAEELSQKGKCKLCNNIDELLELKPDYIAEAASGQAVRDYALKFFLLIVTLPYYLLVHLLMKNFIIK